MTKLLSVLFFITGATSLMFEVLWVRGLTLVVGNTTFAVSLVVATFLLGLALGNAVAGRVTLWLARPLWGYAIAELSAGLLALAVTLALPRFPMLLASVGLPGGGPIAARLAIVAALMLPPTLAMGASLPMLASWVGREFEDAGVRVATLYTVNTFGAAAGCATTGLWLVAAVGVSATAQLACALDVIVGGVAVALALRTRG